MASYSTIFLGITYTLVSLAVIIIGTQKLTPMGVGLAVIYAVGTFLLLLFFGIRWFSESGANSTNWPPTINMCPDYLTFIPTVTDSTSASGGGCVDKLGVTSRDAGLQKIENSELATLSSTNSKLFRYTSADVNAAINNPTELQNICNECQIKGVTWEGVYDGDACLGLNRAKLAAARANCPPTI